MTPILIPTSLLMRAAGLFISIGVVTSVAVFDLLTAPVKMVYYGVKLLLGFR